MKRCKLQQVFHILNGEIIKRTISVKLKKLELSKLFNEFKSSIIKHNIKLKICVSNKGRMFRQDLVFCKL